VNTPARTLFDQRLMRVTALTPAIGTTACQICQPCPIETGSALREPACLIHGPGQCRQFDIGGAPKLDGDQAHPRRSQPGHDPSRHLGSGHDRDRVWGWWFLLMTESVRRASFNLSCDFARALASDGPVAGGSLIACLASGRVGPDRQCRHGLEKNENAHLASSRTTLQPQRCRPVDCTVDAIDTGDRHVCIAMRSASRSNDPIDEEPIRMSRWNARCAAVVFSLRSRPRARPPQHVCFRPRLVW